MSITSYSIRFSKYFLLITLLCVKSQAATYSGSTTTTPVGSSLNVIEPFNTGIAPVFGAEEYVFEFPAGYNVLFGGSIQLSESSSETTVTLVSGTIPAGISFNTRTSDSILFSGRGTNEGVYNFVLEIKNEYGSDQANVIWTVSPGEIPQFEETSYSFQNIVGDEIIFQNAIPLLGLRVPSQPATTIALSSGSLPPGTRINNVYNEILLNGEPAEVGTFEFILEASNEFGSDQTKITWVISPNLPPDFPQSSYTVEGQVGGLLQRHGIPLTNNGYIVNPEVTLSLISGTLPPGNAVMMHGHAQVLLNGIPREHGIFETVLEVSNEFGSDRATVIWKISPAIIPEVLPSVFTVYTGQELGNNFYTDVDEGSSPDAPPLTISFEGEFPTGILYDKYYKGKIYFKGTPEKAGFFEQVVTIDYGSGSNSAGISWSVNPAALPKEPPRWKSYVGENIEPEIPLFDGKVPENSSISVSIQGNLPPGITAIINRYVSVSFSGVPTEAGHWNFTILAQHSEYEEQLEASWTITRKLESIDELLTDGLYAAGGGVYYSDWFGFLYTTAFPWVYHYELGWIYILEESESQDAFWFYAVGAPINGWAFSGRGLGGFFYFETEPDIWAWEWLNTGTVNP